jgi:class 3 adenylate cyclase/tetratricopeptide (TPR) repeat protein
MSAEQQQLEAGIRALEAQRALLGDAVVDASLGALRARLAALASSAQPPVEPAQTLKQVSILFLDVVGSTLLSQHLDPEAISAVMDDALARGTAMVDAHRGKVLQYAGDNILAAFGAEASTEDDAERAVHCGLALLELGRVLGAEVQAAHGHAGFNVRVGIHTGGVLLGGGVDADGSIRGIAVNIAARMEQTAPPGALRISHDTYAQVRGLFEVEAQEPLAVKGVDAPVQSYLVRSAKPRSFRIGTRGIEGVTTRMIGRESELEALQAAFKRLFDERRLAAVTVVADAGIGKSRLLYEFEAWSEARPETFCLFRGRATPQTGHQAYGLLRDILAWRFQIADDDPIEAARQKMEAGIVPLFIADDGAELAEAHAHLLGHLIGIEWQGSRHLRGILDDPKQIRNRAFHSAAQLFRRVSASNDAPAILLLEDLHWADNESLDFLNYLAEVDREVPMLVLAFTRPTLFERRKDWSSTDGIHQRIDLAPLGRDMSRLLAGELLKKLPEIPAALSELLTSSAEGNPFYMEELVKMLIDQGAILTRSETGYGWKINGERLLLTQVPPTLTGVLQARLDGLPVPEKRALQQASVVGAVFWDRALAAIEAQAAEQLPALARRELTLPRPEAPLEGLREYAFRHQLLHQVTYDTVLKRQKREGHAKVAQWLADLTQQGGPRAGEFLGLAAVHFEQAGDAGNAAEFHARAAEHAGQRFSHERVLVHVGRALALLGAPTAPDAQAELRWRLLLAREGTFDLQARRDEQQADLDALAQIADELEDDRRRAQVALRRSSRAMRMGDWTGQASAARQGAAFATRAEDDGLRLHALRLLAGAHIPQGEIRACQALALEGLADARRLRLHDIEARLLNVLAIAASLQGNLVVGLDLMRRCLKIHRETGDRIGEATILSNLGISLVSLGDFTQAQLELDAALKMLRANGQRTTEGATLCALSVLALLKGDEARALALAQSALDIATAAQARGDEVRARQKLGRAELALGRRIEAREAFVQVWAQARELNSTWQHDASAGLAQVALAEGDPAAALSELRSVLEHVAAGGALDGTDDPRWIELTCYQTLTVAGGAGASDWLERAHSALMAQADALTDPALRHGLLQNIPHHREIVAAWAKRSAGGEAGAAAVG